MYKWLLIGASIFLSCGCMTITPESSDGDLAAKNLQKAHSLKIGMPKADALSVMGTGEVRVRTAYYQYGNQWQFPFDSLSVRNPVRNELWNSPAGKTYEILFYFTRIVALDGIVGDDETTPLIMENDILIGQGWPFFNELIKKESLQKQTTAVSASLAEEQQMLQK